MSIFGTQPGAVESASYSDPFALPEKKRNDDINKDDFMMLLVEQLKNQDPLEPMDSTDFTAQLAQFSSLEQQTQTNDNLELLQDYSATLNRLSALNMIGREVEFDDNGQGVARLAEEGQPVSLGFELADNAQSVTIEVYNQAGGRVASLDLGYCDLGAQEYKWNGRDLNGESLPAGNYSYKVIARDELGQQVHASVYSRGVVNGVETDPASGATILVLDTGTRVGIDHVTAVNNI